MDCDSQKTANNAAANMTYTYVPDFLAQPAVDPVVVPVSATYLPEVPRSLACDQFEAVKRDKMARPCW